MSTREAILQRLEAQEELLKRLEDDLLSRFAWNEKQWMGMNTTQKLCCIAGANQYSGKTTCNTARQCIHLTNLYPEEWTGKRWLKPIRAAVCTKTLGKLRDTLLNKMFGPRQQLGTGWIPKSRIVEESIVWSKREKDLIEYAQIRRLDKDGCLQGFSEVFAFSFEQGWDRVSGYTLHDVLVSEECSHEFFREMWQRTNYTKGQVVMDMVPLLGETALYTDFARNQTGRRELITITIDDCTHLSEEEREDAKIEHGDDPWKEAVLYGRPVRGAGLIFNKPERDLVRPERREDFPLYYKTIIGIDVPHTTGAFAAVKLVHDSKKDVIDVVEAIKLWDMPREVQIDRLLAMGGGQIPVAWPHDTQRTETDIGGHVGPMVESFRRKGCNMLHEPAYALGIGGKKVNSPMVWISDVRDRERSGRMYYNPDVQELLLERSKYSQAKGKIEINQDDHCLDALGKAILMLRYGRPFAQVLKRPYGRRGPGGEKERIVRRREVDFFSI